MAGKTKLCCINMSISMRVTESIKSVSLLDILPAFVCAYETAKRPFFFIIAD
jgi:hypothetical protein